MIGLVSAAEALSAEECAELIAQSARGGVEAPLFNREGLPAPDEARGRRATSVLLSRGEGPTWLFGRLDRLFDSAAAAFALPVDPVFEPVQIVRYREGDHFKMWHSDAGTDLVERRRISMSIELSDPGDYEGGLLEIAPVRMIPQGSPGRGHATLFPSRMLHRVTPVTRGIRYALVAWTGLNAA